MKEVDVLVGRTWPAGSLCRDHYRLYGTERSSSIADGEKKMLFNGMDGVIISDAPSRGANGCWADVDAQPVIIEGLVGPKGLAFLKLLKKVRVRTQYVTSPVRGQRKKTKVLFREIHVVSAWQFTVVDGFATEKLILSAIKKHLKMNPKKQEWVLK